MFSKFVETYYTIYPWAFSFHKTLTLKYTLTCNGCPGRTLASPELILHGLNSGFFRVRKVWWMRYNYVLSAALDAGLAFMGVLLYFALQLESKSINWWGVNLDNCPLATCPTAPGIVKAGCPVF